MAEMKTLNTRIKLRIDTLENWNASEATLLPGELCFATVAATAGNGLTEPVIMAKIATEEGKKFSDLPWAFHAKSSDVLAACKSETALKAFVNGVIADAGIATNEAMEALAGRVGTAEGKITALENELNTAETGLKARMTTAEGAIDALEALVGDKKVATQISEAIAALNLATTYEAKGEAAKVSTALETYKTSNDAKILEHTNAISANTNAITAIKDGESIDSFADVETALAGKETSGAAAQALVDAKAYADGLAKNYDASGSAAAAETAAKAYADGLASNYDAVGSADAAEAAAKKHADDELARLVGTETVSTQINNTIDGLKLADTYDAKGAAATAESNAKAHANSLNTAMNTRVEALEAIDHDHGNKAVLDGITAEKVTAWDAAEQNAKDYADGLDEVMDGRVAAIEAKFGEGEGNVESQIEAAVAAEAKLREEADADLLELIEANDADILALQGLVGGTSVATQIETAVKAEADRAQGIEGGLETRLAAVEGDYLKAADKKALQDQIDANESAIELLTNGVKAEEVDGVNDLIQYVKDHGAEVTGIKADIKANADAIDAIEADYLKAADKTELAGDIDALEGRMDAAETAIATKAAQADLEALAGRVTTVEGDLNTATTGLKARMTAAEADIDALQTKVGDKTVTEQIKAVTDDLDSRIDALEAIDHTHDNKSVLDGISATKVSAWDAAVQTVTAAAGSGLKATKTGTDVAIAFDDSVTFVFDCGNATV